MTLSLSITLVVASTLLGQTQNATVPNFSIRATDGKTYSRDRLRGKPTVVVFINADCPHNAPAIPEVNELFRQVGSQANFLAFINRDLAGARAVNRQLKLRAPLLPDKEEKTILALGGSHSLDFAIISSDGKSVKGKWGGVSRNFIGEMQATLRQEGAPQLSLNLSRFKTERRSGCGF
ncbi:MAG: redoxin domain-containing protein [Fimbriimonadaceae bacterium]|jgi:hypothetical protein|nr:redoxin domain-containing protein [Fimbriimonadaceae bacterium]